MAELFLSYSRTDLLLAEGLARTLTDLGVEVWWDQRLLPGEDWQEEIRAALARADAAVILITPASLHSSLARAEWQQAIAATDRVLPILAGDADYSDLPPEVRHIQALRLSGESLNATVPPAPALADFVNTLTGRSLSTKRERGGKRRLDYLANPFGDIRASLLKARSQIDLAASALEGLFRPLPTMLSEIAGRSVHVRVVLPDPDYFSDPARGRSLEASAKSRTAIQRLLRAAYTDVSVRLIAQPIVQSMLRIDDVWFIDPLPASSASHGYLRLGRGHANADLFTALSSTFEGLFISGRPSDRNSLSGEALRSTVDQLKDSPNEQDLERAAQLYFTKLGYETALNTQVAGNQIDLLMWNPKGGPPAVAEVKRLRSPVSRAVVEQLISSARHVGADRAFLVTNQPLTMNAQERLRATGEPDVDIVVLTPDIILESLRDASA